MFGKQKKLKLTPKEIFMVMWQLQIVYRFTKVFAYCLII